MAIMLYSGTPGSYKSYHAVIQCLNAFRFGRNLITNFPLNYKKRIKKPIKGVYECVNNLELTVDYLIDFAVKHHKPSVHAQTLVVIDEARDNINKRNATLIDDLNKSVEKARSDVNEKNKAIAYDINSTVEDMNEQIRNTSTLKMVLNKKKSNLRVPTEDLLKPFEFDFDVDKLISGQALELDAAEILKEVMPKLPEPFSKYIDTLDEEPETIDVSSKKEE